MPRGGKRAGAGRKQGQRNALTIEMKASLAETARALTPMCLQTLADIASDTEATATARAICANSLLDRAWGRAVQPIVEAEFSRISDGELLEDLARQARELGVEIDVAYRVIEGDDDGQ